MPPLGFPTASWLMADPDLPESEQAEGTWAISTPEIHVDSSRSSCESPGDSGRRPPLGVAPQG